jgi:opacity protein-like surface antigen
VGVTGAWPAIYWLSEDGRLDLGGGIGGAVHLGWQARSWLGVEFVGDFASGVYWGDDIGSAIGTVGPRFQSPRGPVRPYASLGVGGGAAELDNGSGDGWVGFAAFRAAAGLDFHVTDSVSILVEGAGILGLWPSDTTYIQLAPRVGAAYRF